MKFRNLPRGVAILATSVAVIVSLGRPAPAQTVVPPDQGPVTLTADHIEYDTQTGNVLADGHVVATRGGTTITADHLTGNLKTGDVQAAGHVVLTQPGRTATGESLKYNYRTRVGEMSQAVAKYAPWTVTGRTVTTEAGQGVALAASATPCDPAHPAFRVTARRVVIVPDDYLKAYDAVLYVYGVPVFYVPVYTVSLKRGRNAASGPSLGYDNYNGIWAAYTQYVPLGDWASQVSAFYGTRSGLSGSADIYHYFSSSILTFHFGRVLSFDQNGNQFNLDQKTVEWDFYTRRVGSLPLSYQLGAQAGTFFESQSGASAFRSEALLTLTTDSIRLSPTLSVSAGGYYRYDAYSAVNFVGTLSPGNVRNILAASAAMIQVLSPASSTTLSYNFATVYGTTTLYGPTPFLFDSIGTDSAISLSYSYYPGGFFASGTISGTYDFLTQQTIANLALSFTVSPSIQFGASMSYSVTAQQISEIDYVVNATCDCISLGVLYTTFPSAPSANRWYITLGINTLPGVSTTYKFGGTP